MVRLTLRTLRYRKGGFVATFIALFLGAMIVMACGGLMETGIRTAIPTHRFAGADIVVTGDRHYELPKRDPADEEEDTERALLSEQVALDPGLVGKLAGVSGVARAVGDVSFPAYVNGTSTTGHGWESAQLAQGSLTGAEPRAGQVVLGSGQVGDQVSISVRGETRQYTVSGVFPQDGIYFAASDATRLGKLTSIGLTVTNGTDVSDLASQIKKTFTVSALTGEDRGAAEYPAALKSSELLITIAGVFGGFAVMVLMMVVASTLGLSIRQRKREIALLRAIGTTPRQVRRMVFFEALVLSVLATAAAWIPGSLVGRWLFTQFAGKGVVDSVIEFHQGWIPSVVGVGAAILTSQVAAMAAARRAAQTRPTEALAEAAVQRKWLTPFRAIAGTLCCLGGLALAIVTVTAMHGPIAASTAGPAVLLWAFAFSLLAPGVSRVVLAVLKWPVRALSSVPGSLALSNAKVRRIQLAAAIAPVMLASGFALAQIYIQTTSVKASQEAYDRSLRADFVLQSTSGGFSPDVVAQLRATPGVTAASAWVTSTGYVDAPYDSKQGDDGLALQGVTASGASALTAVDLASGSLDSLTGNTVALPARHAEAMKRGIGDTVTMRFGDGRTVDTRIVALLNEDQAFETALLPAQLVAEHTDTGAATRIMARGSAANVHVPNAQVVDRSVLTASYAEDQRTSAWINYLLAGLIVLYTAITVINTLVVETADRRREFGLLRLSGARRGQVMRMAGVEGALIAVTGLVLGTAISAGSLVPFAISARGSVLPDGPLWIFLVVAGAVGLLTMAATLVPAWIATRQRPVDTVVAP
ncbi:FtsX-like permease family protein [Actinocrispum wychmicini]|uniref:Putative ABC transport system permease protein n=1 Tax=Actinocrispum wychmicini TaxID=1213861 RepID=A0A4R2JH13_9PSEU|nr:FtsX-like permease family protein [Actinocrispum wychmicini]TCO53475.1 putative ABC transport system permease protein [Actinocrispum wychmicini]